MEKVYQYNASRYYVGETCHYGGPLPNNTTLVAPDLQEGYIPRWIRTEWEQVENHKDKEGYVNGERFTIKEYGPLPEGWSDTPPPLTEAEFTAQRLAAIDSRLAELDAATIRPMRALLDGSGTGDDKARLAALEQEAQALREERKGLVG